MPKATRASRSYKPLGSSTSKAYKFQRSSKIHASSVEARLKNKRVLETLPRVEQDFEVDWGPDIGEDIIIEPIPAIDDDCDWEDLDLDTIEDGAAEERVDFVEHFLSTSKTRHYRTSRAKRSYRDRLEVERHSWANQMEALTEAFMQWKTWGEDTGDRGGSVFACNVISIPAISNRDFKYISGEEFASVRLVRAGYIPTAPLIPTTAFAIETLEFYRVLNKHHRRIGLQPFMRALLDYHGKTRISVSAHAFSRAYDCYLEVRRRVQGKVDWALGRIGPDARLRRACPACTYRLQNEPVLPYSLLLAGDGNMSLRRFKNAGRTDDFPFQSSYFLSQVEVDKYAGVVQARKKPGKKPTGATVADEEAVLEDDVQDAELENEDRHAQQEIDQESGNQPVNASEDPLMETFGKIAADCAERWKANADDEKKVMWDCFDECGVFVTVCRHGQVLVVCDIVRSGELSKYPLALLAKLQEIFPDAKLVGYDIGCSFKSTARRGLPTLNARFTIPSMHGYAHNRMCQLSHHPKYIPGAGREDFEGCERFFSSSNNCAGITRYTTRFHRHQLLDTHFTDSDETKRLSISKWIYINYVDALTRISKLSETFQSLGLMREVEDGTFGHYLKQEEQHLISLTSEPIEEQARFKYVEALQRWWGAHEEWEKVATRTGIDGRRIHLNKSLPPDVTTALAANNEAHVIAAQLERILNIPARWTPESEEYKESLKWANERKYRVALDRLERLVIQRLFELQKANLVGTGYKMRRQIARHLKARSQTIRSAITTYNKAATALRPPRETLQMKKVMDMAFLSQFDLLRFPREGHDVRRESWANPATRVLTDKYFELLRSKEEIARLDVEWSRVRAWVKDERKLYSRALSATNNDEHRLLHHMLLFKRNEMVRQHRVILYWLARTQLLTGFSGDPTRKTAVDRERINRELFPLADDNAESMGEEDRDGGEEDLDDDDESEDGDPRQGACLDEREELNSMVDTVGTMSID